MEFGIFFYHSHHLCTGDGVNSRLGIAKLSKGEDWVVVCMTTFTGHRDFADDFMDKFLGLGFLAFAQDLFIHFVITGELYFVFAVDADELAVLTNKGDYFCAIGPWQSPINRAVNNIPGFAVIPFVDVGLFTFFEFDMAGLAGDKEGMHIQKSTKILDFVVRHVTVTGSAIGPVVRAYIKTDMVEMALYSLLFEHSIAEVVFHPILAFKDHRFKCLFSYIFFVCFFGMLNGNMAFSGMVFMDKMGKGQFPDEHTEKNDQPHKGKDVKLGKKAFHELSPPCCIVSPGCSAAVVVDGLSGSSGNGLSQNGL